VQSRGTLNSEHELHDGALVARYAAGDSYPQERAEAARLVDNCDNCAALAADIRLISARTADLPHYKRPRDFRLTPEQADRLRGSWFDRFMRRFATPGWSIVRPLAAASLAIGLVLVVVGALPIGLTGSAAPANFSAQDNSTQAAGVPVAASTAAALPPQAPAATAPRELDAGGAATSVPGAVAEPEMHGPSALPGPAGNGASAPGTPVAADAYVTGAPLASAAPPKALSSAPAAAKTAEGLVTAPVAAPSATGHLGAVTAQPNAPTAQTASQASLLIPLGLLIAFLALVALGLVWTARRRYSDPLIR